MAPLRDRPVLVIGTVAMLLAAGAGLQAARDRWLQRPPVSERLLYLQSGTAVKRFALAFDALAADIYWIRAVQHYGGDRLGRTTGARYALLYPLLDITTTLDPHFSIAYRFGAFFLADKYPSGAGRPDQAVALLRKGIRAEPQKWQYMQDIGFVYFWAVGDLRQAGEWYLRASQVPGAPNWMRLVAASMMSGRDREASRFLWREIYETTESDWVRRTAARSLRQFDAIDDLERINNYLRPRLARLQPGPFTWERLIATGVIRRVPTDPDGVPYALNSATGEANLSSSSPLYPFPAAALERARAKP